MFCMNCGKALPDGAKFCMYCGTPLGAAATPAQSICCLPGRKYLSGHTAANRAAEDYYNNLYLLTQDGRAVFLNAGGRRCTGLFVQDNAVHWTENGQTRSVPLPL